MFKKNKKILHIWDTAGVGSVLAKYQRKLGYQVKVIASKHQDPLNITKFYKNELWQMNKNIFGLRLILEARKYDVIHIHSGGKIGKHIRKFFGKSLLLHYHGSDVRSFSFDERKENERFYNKILLATPDLLEWDFFKKPIYLPNPVDTELFSKRDFPANNKGLIVLKKGQKKEELNKLLKLHGIEIDLEVLETKKRMSFLEFLKFRQNYEYYLDLPFVNNQDIHAHSLTGLQSMAMGQKVIDFKFNIIKELPPVHEPTYVIKKLDKIYDELLTKN